MNNIKIDGSSIYDKDITPNVSRSLFNLSYIHSTTQDFGELIPTYLQDCVANDDYDIEEVVKIQSLPMATPNFSAWRLKTWYFFVPYILIWHKFDKFLNGGRDGKYTVAHPVIGSSSTGVTFSKGSLGDHLGFPVGVQIAPDDCPSAFPFFAYQRIYRDYFLNQDIQTSTNVNDWFPNDDFDFQCADGFQTQIGTTINLDTIQYKNFDKDYFTSALLSPQRGDPIAMTVLGEAPVVVDYPNLTHSKSFTNNTNVPVSGIAVAQQYNTSSNGLYTSHYTSGTQDISLENVTQGNTGTTGARALLGAGSGFSIDDLRLNVRMQEWLEANMRAGIDYNSFLRAHFNDQPNDYRLVKPYYIGGSSRIINQSEIMQTSETTSNSVQGTMTANSYALDSNYIGHFHAHEPGLIMGISCIIPEVSYSDGIPKEWSRRSRYDYYFPEFADLGMDGIKNKELYVTGTTGTDNMIFGYQGRNDEMRSRRSTVTGLLRDPNSTDFYTWISQRHFTTTPTLTGSFINTNGNIDHSIFPTGTTVPPFICQYGFNVRAVRPLPIRNIPKGLY